MTLINLTGNYGYNVYYGENIAANSTIDATNASWIVSNSANQNPTATTSYLSGSGTINKHPFIIASAGAGLVIKGGTIQGEVPQTSDWAYTYNNSAAIRIDGAPGVTIQNWVIDKTWDGIRIRGDSGNFLIDDVRMSNVRDDAIENDFALSGTIRDSLFDGVFSGISLVNSTNADGSANTVRVQNVLMRMESFLFNGDVTHASFFKTNTDLPGNTPDLRITNSVFAIEDVTPASLTRMAVAWDNVVESSGNVFLNLSDTPLPSKFPLPKSGFTILQGQEARNYWEKAKAAWIDNHDGTPYADVTPLPPISGAAWTPPTAPTPAPAMDTAVYSGLFRSYAVQVSGGTGTVSGGIEGSTKISGIEYIQFQDGVFDFNVNGMSAQVTRLYDTVLQRSPDQIGLDYWVDQTEDSGKNVRDVAVGLLHSSEFQTKTGQLSNAQFVDYLYQHALGRASDVNGKAYWVGQLNSGAKDRADLLVGFSESQEHRSLTGDLVSHGFFNTDDDYQTVALMYDSFAGRSPDPAGLVYWAEALESGAFTLDQVADRFVGSAEFQQLTAGMSNAQLVKFMYQNTLDRAADPVGLQYWTGRLDSGMDHGDLLLGISLSNEHFNLLGSHVTSGIDYF